SASASAPEPLAIARSMLSRGIEYDFAFSIAFCRDRLFAGSPPPSFAATMIARESFEKSWPRFASAAPFLCLIDDHLLCPDNLRLPDRFEEQLVEPRVLRQLRVERGDEETAVACEHRSAVDLGEYLHLGADLVDPRGANEHASHGPLEAVPLEVGLERCNLAAKRVPAHPEVDEAQMVAIEHDHPGARAEDGTVETANRL